MHLVFVSYPYHYHITLVSIKTVVSLYQDEITSITVMFDDIDARLNSKINFIEHMHRDLASLGIKATIIPFSQYDKFVDFGNGWERQQLIKLNLHKILPYDQWVCIDADSIFQEKIELEKLYIHSKDGYGSLPQAYALSNYVLDLNYQKYQHDGLTLDTLAGITVRHIRSSMLAQLEEYIYKLHGCDIADILRSFTLKANRSNYFELAEYDLMAYFEIFIIKQHAPIVDLGFRYVSTNELETIEFPNNPVIILTGRDNLLAGWYHKHGIQINHEVASALKYRKYLL